MTTPRTRRRTAAAALLLPLLAACGFNAQTDQDYQAATGVNDRSGQIDVLNALIVSAKDGKGTFGGTLVNNSPSEADQLVSLTGASFDQPIEVPAGAAVNLAASGEVRVEDQSIKSGAMVRVTLQFASGQTTNMVIPVVPHRDEYADVPVGPTTGATPESSGGAETPAGEPSNSASSTATTAP